MEMADNPKLNLASCGSEGRGGGGLLEENIGTQKIRVLGHINQKSDSFVIDMESFSSNKDTSPSSRITLQRSLSRKGSMRGSGGAGSDKNFNSNPSPNDKDTTFAGTNMPEKASLATVGTTDHSSNQQIHHQITITSASNMNASTESRCTIRRNSFKRPTYSWAIDPKRVLFFFATLSSIGTILLIYFTLSIGKLTEDNALD